LTSLEEAGVSAMSAMTMAWRWCGIILWAKVTSAWLCSPAGTEADVVVPGEVPAVAGVSVAAAGGQGGTADQRTFAFMVGAPGIGKGIRAYRTRRQARV
jgi:hypothetical protein